MVFKIEEKVGLVYGDLVGAQSIISNRGQQYDPDQLLSETTLGGQLRGHLGHKIGFFAEARNSMTRGEEREDESFVRWMQDGMGSSAFPEPRLSLIESGVQRYHNSLQKILPVTRLKQHPGKGRVADVNREMQAPN